MMQRAAKIGILVLIVGGLLVGGFAVAGAVESNHATAAQTGIVAALRPLIDDGTITESQAEAVAGRLAPIVRSERIRRDAERFRDRSMATARRVADMLDMTVPELENELKRGTTLAQIAESRGSSGGEIVTALVSDISKRLADRRPRRGPARAGAGPVLVLDERPGGAGRGRRRYPTRAGRGTRHP
ncbi:MAG TPA: hypothetical protein ENG94_03500 [Actinobacteria bacterium]|nr:hypothetical protein [Actinomycetota bacterium]